MFAAQQQSGQMMITMCLCVNRSPFENLSHVVGDNTYALSRKAITRTGAPASWKQCNNKQKRLVACKPAWFMVGKEHGGREILPACMMAAIRSRYADETLQYIATSFSYFVILFA
jgi:hypothetical protein